MLGLLKCFTLLTRLMARAAKQLATKSANLFQQVCSFLWTLPNFARDGSALNLKTHCGRFKTSYTGIALSSSLSLYTWLSSLLRQSQRLKANRPKIQKTNNQKWQSLCHLQFSQTWLKIQTYNFGSCSKPLLQQACALTQIFPRCTWRTISVSQKKNWA
jgi:hypothetical protein